MGERAEIKPETVVTSGPMANLPLQEYPLRPPATLVNEYVQYGAHCDDQPGSPGCLLTDKQRDRLIGEMNHRLDSARTAYVDAINAVQLDTLLKEEEELGWVASLLLDIVTFGISSKLTSALKALRGDATAVLAGLANNAKLPGITRGWAVNAGKVVSFVSDEMIKEGVKIGVGKVKAEVAKAPPSSVRAERVQQLAELKQRVLEGFQAARGELGARLDDAQLLALCESLDARNHSIPMYVQLLQEKLARLDKSGVNQIGRKRASRLRDTDERNEFNDETFGEHVMRDTRVVWAELPTGRRELRFEFHDGEYVHPILYPKGEVAPRSYPMKFGPGEPITSDTEIGKPVPAEFIETAILRHKQRWGAEPKTVKLTLSPWIEAATNPKKRSHDHSASVASKRHTPTPSTGSSVTKAVPDNPLAPVNAVPDFLRHR